MTDFEDSASAGLDAYIRMQLAGAAEVYASRADLSGRLMAILETGPQNEENDTATADS